MSKYTVCRQEWRHFPKVLVVRNVETGEERRYVPEGTSDANDVLQAVDQLRRDLSGYHGQLKAHNDLQKHCDNQRERISELEGLYAKAKADRDENAMSFSKEHDRAEFKARENARLRKLCKWFAEYASQDRCEGCVYKSRCNDRRMDECWQFTEIRELASELGMEVDQ